MLQEQTQSNFQGFGNGQLNGELHHCTNMAVTPFGLAPFYKNTAETTSAITDFSLVRKFVEYNGIPWAVDDTGKVVSRVTGSWALEHDIAVDSSGNGMIVDQTGRLLVVNDRYLTKLVSITWTETWKDLGSAVTGDKVMDTYLDWVVIPHGNAVALLNTTDDSFNAASLTFPTGCKCFIARSNRTGILLGVNMGNRSFVALWDAQSTRAITDWMWFDHPLKSICRAGDAQWIVTTTREIVITNGYTRQTLPSLPDPLIPEIVNNPIAGGTLSIGNDFYLAQTINGTQYGRRQSGLYILDLATLLWRFVPASDGATQNIIMGAVFEDSTGRVWLSHRNVGMSNYNISNLTNQVPPTASFITAPFAVGTNRKVVEAIKVEIVANSQLQVYADMTFTVSAKIYDFRRPLWTKATNGTSLAANQLVVVPSGTSNRALVGDEVTILSGQNAGQIRHIITIANVGGTETWTLDSALTYITEVGAIIQVQPFKLAKKFVITSLSDIPADGLYFDVQNRYKGKQFLVKLVFENMPAYTGIAIPSVTLIFDHIINP